MDSFVKTILAEWDMSHLIQVFEENEIGEADFKELTEADLLLLIPKLVPRKRFSKNLENLKTSFALNTSFQQDIPPNESYLNDTIESEIDVEECGKTNDVIDDILNTSNMYEQNTVASTSAVSEILPNIYNSVWNLLNSCDEGRMIVRSVGNNFKRNDLVRFVIKHELNNSESKSISTTRFQELAKLIVACFPHEKECIYYIPYYKSQTGTVVSARGKLWTSYRHMRQKYRTLNMLNKTVANVDVVPVVEVTEEEKDLLLWLKEATEPFPDVQKAWGATFNSRSAEKGTLSIEQVIKKYKCLSHPLGYLLLQDDFKKLFINQQIHSFVDKFTILNPRLIEFAKSKNKISHLKDSFKQFQENYPEANEDAKLIFGLRLIPLLVGSSVMKFKNRTHWKPSRIEVQNGFLLCVDTVANLEVHLGMLSRLYAKHNLTIQPLPVVVGNWQNPMCYVVLNDIRYLVESPLAAFDLAFKIIYALDASYPSEAQSSWVFVQEGLYGIDTKGGKGKYYTAVKALLADLRLDTPD